MVLPEEIPMVPEATALSFSTWIPKASFMNGNYPGDIKKQQITVWS